MENTALFETSRTTRASPFDRGFPSRNLTAFSTNQLARAPTWTLPGTNLNSIWNNNLNDKINSASTTPTKLENISSVVKEPVATLQIPSNTQSTSFTSTTRPTPTAQRLSTATSERPVMSPIRHKSFADRLEYERNNLENVDSTKLSLLSGSSPDVEELLEPVRHANQTSLNNSHHNHGRDQAYSAYSATPTGPTKHYYNDNQTHQPYGATLSVRPLDHFPISESYDGANDLRTTSFSTGTNQNTQHDPTRAGMLARQNHTARTYFQQGFDSDIPVSTPGISLSNGYHDYATDTHSKRFTRQLHDFTPEGQEHHVSERQSGQHKAFDPRFIEHLNNSSQWTPRFADDQSKHSNMSHGFITDYAPQIHQTPSFGDRGSTTTVNSDYRGSLQSPYYSTSATPPTGPESVRSASISTPGGRPTHGHLALVDRKLRTHLEQHPHERHLFSYSSMSGYGPYNGQHEYQFSASSMRMNPMARSYVGPSYRGCSEYAFTPSYREYEDDRAHVHRSALLEEFRANAKTNNKRYDLKDIYNYIVEFSGDQHGSRFIQLKLETANSDEKDQLFSEIQPDALQLMQDVFGNYVIQKFFEHGNQSQKKALGALMRGKVHALSMSMYGCRVVQKALEHVLTDQQASMVRELDGQVLKVIKDQNGNHVVQKAIECAPAEHVQFIVDAHRGRVRELASHTYGCRVIQRMLEFCQEPAKRMILTEIHECIPALIVDPFGNYVIQHVIAQGDPEDRRRIVHTVQDSIQFYAKHKFGSNVVEKSIEHADDCQRSEMIHQLIGRQGHPNSAQVFSLMRDQFGNYVIQKVVSNLSGTEKAALLREISDGLIQLKRTSFGKQIAAIEKLLHEHQEATPRTSSASSALPSTNASSTAEGANTPPGTGKHTAAKETQIALPITGMPAS